MLTSESSWSFSFAKASHDLISLSKLSSYFKVKGTCNKEQDVETIIFSLLMIFETLFKSWILLWKLLFQIFLPSITPAIKTLFEFLINSKISRFLFPWIKSNPIAQIGVLTKTFVASFECSKYVVTTIFIFGVTEAKAS